MDLKKIIGAMMPIATLFFFLLYGLPQVEEAPEWARQLTAVILSYITLVYVWSTIDKNEIISHIKNKKG